MVVGQHRSGRMASAPGEAASLIGVRPRPARSRLRRVEAAAATAIKVVVGVPQRPSRSPSRRPELQKPCASAVAIVQPGVRTAGCVGGKVNVDASASAQVGVQNGDVQASTFGASACLPDVVTGDQGFRPGGQVAGSNTCPKRAQLDFRGFIGVSTAQVAWIFTGVDSGKISTFGCNCHRSTPD